VFKLTPARHATSMNQLHHAEAVSRDWCKGVFVGHGRHRLTKQQYHHQQKKQ